MKFVISSFGGKIVQIAHRHSLTINFCSIVGYLCFLNFAGNESKNAVLDTTKPMPHIETYTKLINDSAINYKIHFDNLSSTQNV